MTGSLMVAQHLNSFIRHADIVKMANITMLSSLVGTSPDGDYKNALYQAFYLYSNNARGTALDVNVAGPNYRNKFFKDIPYLDVTAVFNDSAKNLVVNVVNRSEMNVMAADIVLQSGEYHRKRHGEGDQRRVSHFNEHPDQRSCRHRHQGNPIQRPRHQVQLPVAFIHPDVDSRQISHPHNASARNWPSFGLNSAKEPEGRVPRAPNPEPQRRKDLDLSFSKIFLKSPLT